MRRILRIVVTGGRDYADRDRVFLVLDLLQPYRVAQGKCRTGADKLARDWCAENDVSCPSHDADWHPDGKTLDRGAGPKRNTRMLKGERPDLVVAFPGGRGTADCVKKAKEMGILTMEIT